MSSVTSKSVVFTPYTKESHEYVKGLLRYICTNLSLGSLCDNVPHLSDVENAVHLVSLLKDEMQRILVQLPHDAAARDALKMMIEQKATVLPNVYRMMIASYMPVASGDEEHASGDVVLVRRQMYLEQLRNQMEDLEGDCDELTSADMACEELRRVVRGSRLPRRLWTRLARFNAQILKGLYDAARDCTI